METYESLVYWFPMSQHLHIAETWKCYIINVILSFFPASNYSAEKTVLAVCKFRMQSMSIWTHHHQEQAIDALWMFDLLYSELENVNNSLLLLACFRFCWIKITFEKLLVTFNTADHTIEHSGRNKCIISFWM